MIVWHLDRLYRRPRELEQLLDLLDANPIRVESAQGGSFDLNRHEGRLFARQLVAFANYESAHKGARVARAQQQRAASGLLHGGSHYGYLHDGALHPDESQVLRRIVDDFLTGLSISAIARELSEARIPTPTGNASWAGNTVTSILSSSRLHRRRGAHAGAWEQLITTDESALIRAIRLAPRRDATRSSATLLGAIARCGDCGNRLVSAVTDRGLRMYRCRAQAASCGRVAADMRQLDRAVIAHLEATQCSSSWATPPNPVAIVATLQRASSELQASAESFGAGSISRDDFFARRRLPVAMINQSVVELRTHLRERVLRKYPGVISSLTSLSVSRQRTVIDAFVSNLVVQPRRSDRGFCSKIQIGSHDDCVLEHSAVQSGASDSS